MRKIFKLENLIYLTILALPSYLWRFSLLGVSFNGLDCLLGASFFGWLIYYREKTDYKLFFQRHKGLLVSTGIILLGLIVSVLVNKNYATGAGIIKSWFLLPILFSFVSHSLIRDDKLKNIFLTYYTSAFIVAFASLFYFIFGKTTYDLRLQGFFNSPNYLAMYLAPAFFIFFHLFPVTKKWKQKVFLVSFFVIIYALYFTYSYASWVSIGAAFIFVLVIKKRLICKESLAALLLLAGLFFLQLDKNKFSDLINLSSHSSFSSRIMIWQSAEKILEDNRFWGIGAGNFQKNYLAYQKYFPAYLEWAVPHPHNVYLAFWLYGGFFGLAGFLALIYFWFSHISRSQKNASLKLIGLGIMGYILFHGLVDTTYFKNDLAVVFWLLFTLL